MNLNWSSYSRGARVIAVASGVAFVSLFMLWFTGGIIRLSFWGFIDLALNEAVEAKWRIFCVLVLPFFYVYPIRCVLLDKTMSRIIGLTSSGLPVLMMIVDVLYLKLSQESPENDIEAALMVTMGPRFEWGFYLFFFASIALCYGVSLYVREYERSENHSPYAAKSQIGKTVSRTNQEHAAAPVKNELKKSLEKITKFHQMGFLTDEDFNAKKTELLEKMGIAPSPVSSPVSSEAPSLPKFDLLDQPEPRNATQDTPPKLKEETPVVVPQMTVSFADEIMKLKKMLDAGIITAEEFQSMKKLLISGEKN